MNREKPPYQRLSLKRIWMGRLWKFLCYPVVGLLLFAVSREGMRRELPILQMQLWEVGVPPLRFISRIDLATILALTLLISTCTSLLFAMRSLSRGFQGPSGRRNPIFDACVSIVLATGLLALDMYLMALGFAYHMADASFEFDFSYNSRPPITVGCIVAALAYGLILIFIASTAVKIEDPGD